jgi:hypothetical protein
MRRTMAASRGLATEGELAATVEHEARMQVTGVVMSRAGH